MSKTRLVISKAEIVDAGVLISEMIIIDEKSSEIIRIAKLTSELLEFLKTIEIELDDFMKIQKAKQDNPAFKKLVETFKLYK